MTLTPREYGIARPLKRLAALLGAVLLDADRRSAQVLAPVGLRRRLGVDQLGRRRRDVHRRERDADSNLNPYSDAHSYGRSDADLHSDSGAVVMWLMCALWKHAVDWGPCPRCGRRARG